MILPNNCPLCDDVLLTSFDYNYSSFEEVITRKCGKKVNHILEFKAELNDEVFLVLLEARDSNGFLFSIRIQIDNYITMLIKGTQNVKSIVLPYIEPDFKNISGYLDKLYALTILS